LTITPQKTKANSFLSRNSIFQLTQWNPLKSGFEAAGHQTLPQCLLLALAAIGHERAFVIPWGLLLAAGGLACSLLSRVANEKTIETTVVTAVDLAVLFSVEMPWA